MDELLERKRKKAKIFKTIGVVIYGLEFILLALVVFLVCIHANDIKNANDFKRFKSEGGSYSSSLNDCHYTVSSEFGEIYAAVYYRSSDTPYTVYSLYDQDSKYYYLRSETKTIKLSRRIWVDDYISRCKIDDVTEIEDITINATDSIDSYEYSIGPSVTYTLYDAGNTLGVRARYKDIDFYKYDHKNTDFMYFKYDKSYSISGEELVNVDKVTNISNTLSVSLEAVVRSDRTISETGAWLILIFFPFIIAFAIALFAILLGILVYYGSTFSILLVSVKKSYKSVKHNNTLKIIGGLTSILIFGIFILIGAIIDTEPTKVMDEIETKRKALEEEALRQQEANRPKRGIRPSMVSSGVLICIGGVMFSTVIYRIFIYAINLMRFRERINFQTDIIGALIIAIVLLYFGILSACKTAKAIKKYDQEVEQDEIAQKAIDEDYSVPRFCIYCGTRYSKDAIFCTECGAKIIRSNENLIEESAEAEKDNTAEDQTEDTNENEIE